MDGLTEPRLRHFAKTLGVAWPAGEVTGTPAQRLRAVVRGCVRADDEKLSALGGQVGQQIFEVGVHVQVL